MSLRTRVFVSMLASFSLALLVGCGSGTSNPVAPPSGAFSNTNFSGTYTFSILGANANGTFEMAGYLTACGCSGGTISGGSVDLADPLGPTGASPISGGTYNITKDGRGKASISISTQTRGTVAISLDFVLTSSSHGLIIRFDGNGTGSGSLDLQPNVISQSQAAGAYALSLSGIDTAGNFLSTVGAFTLDSTGIIVGSPAGVDDFTRYIPSSLTATAYPNLPLSGSVQVGSAGAPGAAVLNTGSSGFGSLTFDVYVIDQNHFKLIESDGLAFLVGDVFSQPSTSFGSGTMVFTVAGVDTAANPFAAGGLLSSDGTSKIPSGSEDINDSGTVDGGTNPAVPFSFSGNFVAAGNGRYAVTLTSFAGGTSFVAYPSSGGLLLQEIDNGPTGGITAGVAMAQTSSSISSSSGFGLNLTGADTAGNVDEIAQFTTTSSTFSGLLDENEGGSPMSPQNFRGNYSVGSDGVGSASPSSGFAGMFFYVVDGSTAVFISTDSGQVAVGSFQSQSTPSSAKAAVTQRHMAIVRSVARAKAAKRH